MADSAGIASVDKRALRILVIEDSAPDSLFEEQVLKAAGYAPELELVETAEAMRAALQRPFDLILADYSMPGFSGMEALDVRNTLAADVPFILVSGQISVETAVSVLKSGATDYVSKDQLSRLGIVVGRALKDAELGRERRRLQEQVIQAQRMEAVGQLAGGIAHDFNNLLQVIIGYTEILMLGERKEGGHAGELEEIHAAALRAAELTRQLLSFSRRQMMSPVVLDVNSIFEDMRTVLDPLAGEAIQFEMKLKPGLPPVFADASHLEQAVMNLVINAGEAMPDGGRLEIETAEVVLSEEDAGLMMEARPGRFLRIRVSDNGQGMEPRVLERIFEPFFTTRGFGQRAGLGLSVTYGIIRQHNGWIHVDSRPGMGTRVTLYLPVYEGKHMIQTAAIPEAVPPRGEGERILLVEDEAEVREIARRVLASAGYEVIAAANMKEGLEACDRETNRFDLVFSDVVLPDGNGIDLVKKVLKQAPDIAVLLSSGYADDRSRWKAIQEEGFLFLAKPHTPSVLLRAIRTALQSGRTI